MTSTQICRNLDHAAIRSTLAEAERQELSVKIFQIVRPWDRCTRPALQGEHAPLNVALLLALLGMGTQNGFFRTFDETECPAIALARSIS